LLPEQTNEGTGLEPTSETKPIKGRLRLIIALVITGIVLYVLARYFVGFEPLLAALKNADWRWLACPLVLLLINLFVAGIRWRVILAAAGYQVPLSRLMDAMLATWPLALVTPSRAGDLVRAYIIRDLVPVPQGAGSVLAEKTIDVQSLCLLTMIGGIWMGFWSFAAFGLLALVGLWSALWIWMHYMDRLLQWKLLAKFEDKVKKLFGVFRFLLRSPKHFVGASLLSLFAWVQSIAMITTLLWGFGFGVSWEYVFALWPIALFVGQLPITFAGLGTRDLAFFTLLWLARYPNVEAHKASILIGTTSYALVTTGILALVGLPWMIRFLSRERKAPQSQLETKGASDASS
jgi:uncharacterized protein (TIRG00374 family)